MPLGATLERSARSAAPRRTTADVASVVPNLFHAFETCARIQLELFVGRGELEHLLELVRADDDVRLARAPSRRDVLDRARREDESVRRRLVIANVLVDKSFDVKLSQHQPTPGCVETPNPDILVNLTLRILRLRRIRALVLHANESRSEKTLV